MWGWKPRRYRSARPARSSASSTTSHRQGCVWLADGAWVAMRRQSSTTSRSTGRFRSRRLRTARVVVSRRSVSARSNPAASRASAPAPGRSVGSWLVMWVLPFPAGASIAPHRLLVVALLWLLPGGPLGVFPHEEAHKHPFVGGDGKAGQVAVRHEAGKLPDVVVRPEGARP